MRAHTHTQPYPMQAHIPPSHCLTLCSAALHGGQGPGGCGPVSLIPVCPCPGWVPLTSVCSRPGWVPLAEDGFTPNMKNKGLGRQPQRPCPGWVRECVW